MPITPEVVPARAVNIIGALTIVQDTINGRPYRVEEVILGAPKSVEGGSVDLEARDGMEPDKEYLLTYLLTGDRYSITTHSDDGIGIEQFSIDRLRPDISIHRLAGLMHIEETTGRLIHEFCSLPRGFSAHELYIEGELDPLLTSIASRLRQSHG